MALPLLIFLGLVLGGVLYAVNTVVSGYRDQSTLLRDGELAFHAARSAAGLGERSLENLLAGPPPAAGRGRDLYQLLTATRPTDLDGGEDELEIPYLAQILPEGVTGSVKVLVRFLEVRPLGGPRPPGFAADPLEKRGMLEVEARAEVGAAVRRVVIRRPFRSLYRLPPVMGRFSLYLGSLVGTPEAVNGLTYSPRHGLFQRSASGTLGWPIQVYPMPPTGAGGTPRQRFGSDDLAPLARGGWVGLFGDVPWVLHTTFGPGTGSPLEEGVLVRSYEAIHPSGRFPGKFEKTRRFGFARNILELPMFTGLESTSVPDTSSLLHLAGDAREPIPPVVLGQVFRRYLTYSKLGAAEGGPFTSLRGLEASAFDPADPALAPLAPGSDFGAYSSVMARSVVEPYNRSYDYVVTSDETLLEGGRIEAGTTPWTPPRHLTAVRTDPWLSPRGGGPDAFLYPDPAGVAEPGASGGVVIGTASGTPLWEGAPEQILAGLPDLVAARSVWTISDAPGAPALQTFASRCFDTSGRLRIGTSVHVKTASLSLGPLHVVRGGTLAVDGDLYLTGPITVGRGEALSLVSLGGNVVVQNEEPIVAGLVACRGEVVASGRGLDVRGLLVSSRFDPIRWIGLRGASRIVYDPRQNPAIDEMRQAQYRVHLGSERRLLLLRK